MLLGSIPVLVALLVGSPAAYAAATWQLVGPPGFIDAQYLTVMKTDASGMPYVAYSDNQQGGKLTVQTFDGTSWQTVGGAGVTSDGVTMYDMALGTGNTLYVAYTYYSDSKAYVEMYNGSTWTQLSGALSSQSVNILSIATAPDGTLYAAFDNAGDHKITVKKYQAGAWVQVGDADFSPDQATYVSLK